MGWTDWDVWPWNWTLGDPPATTSTPLSEIRGRVELICGLPLPDQRLELAGTARAAKTDQDGHYEFRVVDPGGWTVRIGYRVPETGEMLTKEVSTATSAGVQTWLPTMVLSRGVSIAGRVGNIGLANHLDYYITVPALGLVTLVAGDGNFVLSGLPPGRSRLVLNTFRQLPGSASEVHRVIPQGVWGLDVDVRTGPLQFFEGLVAPMI